METTRCRLEVRAADLVPALHSLAAAQKRGLTVCVSFAAGELELSRGATNARVAAQGTWPLIASTHVRLIKDLRRLRRELPDVVVLEGTRSMLHFSIYSIPCSWQPHPPEATERSQ
jgi:hypothetical protein